MHLLYTIDYCHINESMCGVPVYIYICIAYVSLYAIIMYLVSLHM